MRYSVLGQVAVTLTGLSGMAAAMGMGAIRRELRLAAEFGINPDSMIKQQKSANELANDDDSGNVVAKTVSVSEINMRSSLMNRVLTYGIASNRPWRSLRRAL